MINEQTIRQWWQIFVGDGNFTEIRILGKFQYSGYFKSVNNLIEAIKPYAEMPDEQIYFALNEINPACYGRQQSEKIVKSPKSTTTDSDIIRRKWVLIDFDPIRAVGVNSSEDEYQAALQKARDVHKYLKSQGFALPIVAKSGNGVHLLLNVDLPNDEETAEILKKFYKYLGQQYTDNQVDIDQKVFNPARISKMYGSVAKKGANIPERPWRMAEFLFVPPTIQTTPLEKFKAIADLLPKEEPKQLPNRRQWNGNNNVEPFDLVNWLNQYGIVYREKTNSGSRVFELEYCPWVESHSDKKKWDSALFLDADGKITFNCQHSHCKDKTWHDVRLHYEPNAYDRPVYQPMQPYGYPQIMPLPQKPKYQIKEESPELGKKWLSFSDINKVDLSSIKTVKTGFIELDRATTGLAEGEVSILSGSNSSGKSSWLNSLALNIINQGEKVALWSGELRPDILKTWVQLVAAGKNNVRPSKMEGKYYVPSAIADKIDAWLDGKFFIYNNEYSAKWEQIFNDMNELIKLGVFLFVLDNLFSLDIDVLSGDKNNKQKELILQICQFAKKNHCHIILVAHPRKVTSFLRKNDISGSSDLSNAVDNVFIAHRVNNDFMKGGADFLGANTINQYAGYGNVIEVAKNRMYGVVDRMFGMYYEIESRRFLNEPHENIIYGWEDQSKQTSLVASVEDCDTNISEEDYIRGTDSNGDILPF